MSSTATISDSKNEDVIYARIPSEFSALRWGNVFPRCLRVEVAKGVRVPHLESWGCNR
jgi:hypothetical protein